MRGNITTGDLLTRERQASPSFSTNWSQAEHCKMTVANLTDLHVTALTLYTNNHTFPLIFDVEARSLGPNVYRWCFLFKSLPPLPADRLLIGREETEAELDYNGKGCLLVYADSGRRDNLRGEVGHQVRTGIHAAVQLQL
jgi:hypothetical protein